MKRMIIGTASVFLIIFNTMSQSVEETDTTKNESTISESDSLRIGDTIKLKTLNLDSLTEREFQYLMHTEKLRQDSLLSVQTKSLSVSEKPDGLYKATTIISIVLSTLSATLLSMSFVNGVSK